MEKIIFFSLVIPIFGFVLYLGVSAIMKGSEAKSALKEEANLKNDENENSLDNKKDLSEEIKKLDQLLKEGVLTQEEFEKAKKKILEN
jgi:uncharacterized membrane protein